MSEYSINQWPEEYREEFQPLISDFRYCKGSLMPKPLESTLVSEICTPPHPLLHECAFSSHTLSQIISTLYMLNYFSSDSTVKVLSLYQKCQAVKVGQFVLGSCSSRHTTASVVVVRTVQTTELKVAQIQYYFKLNVCVESSAADSEIKSFWFAAISLLDSHSCKVWFGNPVQVWSQVTLPDILFIPISFIRSRTAYIATSVSFGRVIGSDRVLVVVPLTNDMKFIDTD